MVPEQGQIAVSLLEEECRLGVEMLRQGLGPERNPRRRLQRCVELVFELAESSPAYAQFIYRQHQRLSVDHRGAVATALSPLVEVVAGEIRYAAESGPPIPEIPSWRPG